MFRKDLSGSKSLLLKTITSDDVLGKEVIDIEGSAVGIVDIVHIDPIKLQFVGISIDEGFLKRGLVIGKQYIQKITPHALFLNIRPAFAMRGMLVFDTHGKLIGKVADVVLWRNRNIIQDIIISTSWFKRKSVTGNYIGKVGQNIFLNITKEDFDELGNEKIKDGK